MRIGSVREGDVMDRSLGAIPAALAALLICSSVAQALPVDLKDQNGTRYSINTAVDPLLTNSEASGAVSDATYNKPVTVTSYFIGLTPFGWFFTTYTQQRTVNVPLTNAFLGFNGFTLTGFNGAALPAALVYNPGTGLASEDCASNGKNRQLNFQPQVFPTLNLTLTRQVYVPDNAEWVRWLNIVTNTGSAPAQVGITLQGLLGSTTQTKVTSTSTGDSTVTAQDLWFTSGQSVPQGQYSTQPRIGFVVQGPAATWPVRSLGISSLGQAIATYYPTIQPGQTVIVMTFVTVQGNNKQVKNTVENLVANPLPSKAIKCMTQQQLKQVINFEPITPPIFKSATITLNFNKTGKDTIAWKGKVTIAQGISLQGLPITVDVGGIQQNFILNKKGQANDGGGNKFALNAELKNGTTKAGTVGFNFHLKGSFQETMASYGLTNATVKKVPVTIPYGFSVGSAAQFGAEQGFTYKAKTGKQGTATGD